MTELRTQNLKWQDPQIGKLLGQTFESLQGVIDSCANSFNLKEPKKLFELGTELSWVSLFERAMAINLGDRVSFLREISLYEKDSTSEQMKHKGRPDLMASIDFGNRKSQMLIEAKMGEWKGGWKYNKEELVQYYSEVYAQAKSYSDHLKAYIKDYEPVIILIFFDWMRTREAVNAAKAYLDKQIDQVTDFHALFTLDDYGVWVYGQVRLPVH